MAHEELIGLISRIKALVSEAEEVVKSYDNDKPMTSERYLKKSDEERAEYDEKQVMARKDKKEYVD